MTIVKPIAVLIEDLDNDNASIRQSAAEVLGSSEIQTCHALSSLIRASRDSVSTVRVAAIKALGKTRRYDPLLISALSHALVDELPEVRWTAAEALREIGPLRPAELPILRRALKDINGSVRWRAAEALADLGTMASDAIPDLVMALGDKRHWVRWHSDRALTAICNERDLIPHLIKALRDDESSDVRLYVAKKLAKLSCAASVEATLVLEGLNDPDPAVRAQVAFLIGRIGLCPDTTTIQAITNALLDPNSAVRSSAAAAIGRLGIAEPTTISYLISCLSDTDHAVRTDAAVALTALGHSTLESVQILGNSLQKDPRNTSVWQALMSSIQMQQSSLNERYILWPEVLECILPEVIALGVLPTIGLKVWQPGAQVEFPSPIEPYPWEDRGVYHNWMSHASQGWPHQSMAQACIHSDWFDDVHLIALTQLISFRDFPWNPSAAPVLIEGKQVGPIVQSGGNLIEVNGMRALPGPWRTNRIDFLYSHDLRLIQYLVFSAMAAQMPQSKRRLQEEAGAAVWIAFSDGLRNLLSIHKLDKLSATQWFLASGWKSSRYLLRYERSFDELQPMLHQLYAIAGSIEGSALQTKINQHIQPLLARLENVLWVEGLRGLPEVARQSIISARSIAKDKFPALVLALHAMDHASTGL